MWTAHLDCGGGDAALGEASPVWNTNNTDRKNDGHNDVAGYSTNNQHG